MIDRSVVDLTRGIYSGQQIGFDHSQISIAFGYICIYIIYSFILTMSRHLVQLQVYMYIEPQSSGF